MGKLAVIALVVWLLMGEAKPDKPSEPQPRPGENLAGGIKDLTGAVDRATQDARNLLTAGSALGDAFARAGSVFSGGTPASVPDQSMGRTGASSNSQTVTDQDQVYSAEDPVSWGGGVPSMMNG